MFECTCFPTDVIVIPQPAFQAGFRVNTFKSVFDTGTVDLQQSNRSGFRWYPWQFFGTQTNLGAISVNQDTSVTLNGDTTGPNGELASVAPIGGGNFVGTAFGGGGYFEATLQFNPNSTSSGWPSFWSMAEEHLVGSSIGADLWPGQGAGYRHFIEADFFEFDVGANVYGGTLHDWYGPDGHFSQAQLSYPDFVRRPPTGTNFNQYHRYGFLWVPATASSLGQASFYFDDVQVGVTSTWQKYANQAPPPVSPWTFSIIDLQHLVIILGTGVGAPMTVQSVGVWQANANNNLVA
jgi:hypothetical protein